jgi:hypothetical protein
MKLTIIISDKAVYKDGLCYTNLIWEGTPINVHALQWLDVLGSIEFDNGAPNEDITVLPDWANNAVAAWQVAYDEAHKPPPDPLPPTAEQNQQTASSLLYQTDWTTIPDVSDPTKSNPYLSNAEEFVIYRNAIRQIAVNPISGYIDWATRPTANWVTV